MWHWYTASSHDLNRDDPEILLRSGLARKASLPLPSPLLLSFAGVSFPAPARELVHGLTCDIRLFIERLVTGSPFHHCLHFHGTQRQ